MEFSFSQLLVLLFFLIPLLERFFGNKKKGQQSEPEPVEIDTDVDDSKPEMTWEETLQQLEGMFKGEPEPTPAPVPVDVPKPRTEFRSRVSKVNIEMPAYEFVTPYVDSPLVSSAEELTVRPIHVKLTKQNIRDAVVINELLMRPVSMRPPSMNRVS
jgi:hypothetical protein